MHNPTRRVKRLKQPLSSTRPPKQPSNDIHCSILPSEGRPITNNPAYSVRHRQPAQPETLRGAMLVALIVVTIVLYLVLWELERSSFTSVPIQNLTQNGMMGSPSSSYWNLNDGTTRYPPAIVREQSNLSLVEGLDMSNGHVALPSGKPSRTTSKTWPPLITRVPEERGTEDVVKKADDHTHKNDITKLSSFDVAYCHGPCRFLLPVRIGEQESKARVHFRQLLVLARRLNRTIVLPNVGKSRMSACSEWPFSAYYDTNGFAYGRNASDFPLAVDLQTFAKWVEERPVSPSSFLVSMESIHQDRRGFLGTQTNSEGLPFIVEKAEVHPKILSCLKSEFARLRASLLEIALTISFDSASLKTDSDAPTRLVYLLSNSLDLSTESDFDLMVEPGYEYTPLYDNSSHLSLADVDVLVLDYDLRHPLFDASESVLPSSNLHYASVLYDLADRLSDNLGPFVGVHWRMENVPPQNLAWCAASLVSSLHALLQDDVAGKNVQYVWLATDHPRPLDLFTDTVHFSVDDGRMFGDGGREKNGDVLDNYGPLRKSSTFKALSVEHDDAIGILIEAFQPGGELEAWKLTDLAQQLRRYPYVEGRFEVNETLLDDSGVFGILDKLVVVQARMFFSGSKDCGKTSSFSKQVVEARKETLDTKQGKRAIHNVVEYFGK